MHGQQNVKLLKYIFIQWKRIKTTPFNGIYVLLTTNIYIKPSRAMKYLRRKEHFVDKAAANQVTVLTTHIFAVIIAFSKPIQELLRKKYLSQLKRLCNLTSKLTAL
jgi:hypothetical protein